MELERRAFDTYLQANVETYKQRLSQGHVMLGAAQNNRLVGIVSFSYGRFSRSDFASFPKTFREFSMQSPCKNHNTMFLYNLGIEPTCRGTLSFLLLHSAFERAMADGCTNVVSEGMIPSYAGNTLFPRNPTVKSAIDRFASTGEFPSDDEFLLDPMLSFYRRLSGCEFIWLMPDFVPEDKASNGWRVILHSKLADYRPWLESKAITTTDND